jgi:hypothetical protein
VLIAVRDGLKILVGVLVGAIVALLFVPALGGGGMGSMMSGSIIGGGLSVGSRRVANRPVTASRKRPVTSLVGWPGRTLRWRER